MKVGKYVQVYGWHLEKFLERKMNVRRNPYHDPKLKYSEEYQWWWRDLEHEKVFKEIAGKEYPFPPYISTMPCEGMMRYRLKNMVKYGLLTPNGEGYDVTDYGKEVYKEWCQYLVDIGARKAVPNATV